MVRKHPVPTAGPPPLPRHLSDEWLFTDPLAIAGEPEPDHDLPPQPRRRPGRRRRALALAGPLLLLATALVAAWWHVSALSDSRIIPARHRGVTAMTPDQTCACWRISAINH